MDNFKGIKHFQEHEFHSPDTNSGGELMDRRLLLQLDAARELYGKPMRINSGYRTKSHNKKVGGSETSSHLNGTAVDIHCANGFECLMMLKSLIACGFDRIGIGKTFIHVDTDTKARCVWTY